MYGDTNKNNLELIELSKIMTNLRLKRLHINYTKQGYKISTIISQKKIVLTYFIITDKSNIITKKAIGSFYRYSILENDMIFPADSECQFFF